MYRREEKNYELGISLTRFVVRDRLTFVKKTRHASKIQDGGNSGMSFESWVASFSQSSCCRQLHSSSPSTSSSFVKKKLLKVKNRLRGALHRVLQSPDTCDSFCSSSTFVPIRAGQGPLKVPRPNLSSYLTRVSGPQFEGSHKTLLQLDLWLILTKHVIASMWGLVLDTQTKAWPVRESFEVD